MCYHPITIVNPTKYVSLRYRDRFLLRVPCGKCAQCQTNKKNEYYLRSFYHAKECMRYNGFVLFDTLTYAPLYLPHIKDYFPTKYNFPCFDSSHVRKFIAKLRQRVKRRYKSNFDFFLTSEYGTSEKHLHLPHYHILFFVRGSITPLEMSAEIADCWFYGRTDGIKYKSRYYVLNNVLNGDFSKSVRILKYVSKYISKSCLFTKQINKRVQSILFEVSRLYGDEWLDSFDCQLLREKLLRHIGQFHRQSTGFGEILLRDLDIDEVFKTGSLSVVDNENVLLRIPLPMYYKRKLFYQQKIIDGVPVWVPTELGNEYLRQQELKLVKLVTDRYNAAKYNAGLTYDVPELVDYLLNYRGRINAPLPSSTFEERIENVDLFKYATRYDRHNLGKLGLVKHYLGNSRIGYNVSKMPEHISLFSFSKRFCFFDDEKEKILSHIDYINGQIDNCKQSAYELRQRLTNIYHAVFGSS